MAVEEIVSSIRTDGSCAGLQRAGELTVHLSRDFEGDVEELPEVNVVPGASLIMAERRGEFLRVPVFGFLRRRQAAAVNVHHGFVGFDQFFETQERPQINFLRDAQRFAAFARGR